MHMYVMCVIVDIRMPYLVGMVSSVWCCSEIREEKDGETRGGRERGDEKKRKRGDEKEEKLAY